MKKNNYDIVLVDKENEFNHFLNKTNEEELNIIYSRLITSIRIGEQGYALPYDTALITEKKKVLLLNIKHQEELRKKLEERKLKYHEVTFQEENYSYQNLDNKKIVFVNGNNLVKRLKECKEIANRECTYYTRTRGKFNLRYHLRDDNKESLLSEYIRGALEFKDRVLFFVNQKDEDSYLSFYKIIEILEKENITVIIDDETTSLSITKPKELKKIKE